MTWCYCCETLTRTTDLEQRKVKNETLHFCPHCGTGPSQLWPWFLDGETGERVEMHSARFIQNALIKNFEQVKVYVPQARPPRLQSEAAAA